MVPRPVPDTSRGDVTGGMNPHRTGRPSRAPTGTVPDDDERRAYKIAGFFRQVIDQDADRAHKCHDFLAQPGGTDNTSPKGAGCRQVDQRLPESGCLPQA